jgi:ribonuclease BN (tRNA processing enzyme)
MMASSAALRFPEPLGSVATELVLRWSGHELVGTSVAALATAFVTDRFRTAVDMGRCSAMLASQETVLLTHCHSDHVAGLVAWLSAHTRRFEGAPTRIVVPSERRQALLGALEVWPELDGVRRRVRLEEVVIPATAGDSIPLAGDGSARAFEVHHSVPSLGWALQAASARRPIFAFAGDGTVLPFDQDPSLLDAEIAVVDCSFVEDGTRVAARLGGHGHLQDWLELAPRLTCDALVLAHLPDDLDGVALLRRLESAPRPGPVMVPWIAEPRPGC